MEKFYTIQDVADMLQIDYRTAYGYVSRGELKAVRLGRSWRISEEHLKEFIQGLEANYTRPARGTETLDGLL